MYKRVVAPYSRIADGLTVIDESQVTYHSQLLNYSQTNLLEMVVDSDSNSLVAKLNMMTTHWIKSFPLFGLWLFCPIIDYSMFHLFSTYKVNIVTCYLIIIVDCNSNSSLLIRKSHTRQLHGVAAMGHA